MATDQAWLRGHLQSGLLCELGKVGGLPIRAHLAGWQLAQAQNQGQKTLQEESPFPRKQEKAEGSFLRVLEV